MRFTPQQVLARLKQAARTRGGFIMSVHAYSRAAQRTIPRQDLVNVFLTASDAEEQENGTWRIKGFDEDGAALTVIVAIGDRIEVITAF